MIWSMVPMVTDTSARAWDSWVMPVASLARAAAVSASLPTAFFRSARAS